MNNESIFMNQDSSSIYAYYSVRQGRASGDRIE